MNGFSLVYWEEDALVWSNQFAKFRLWYVFGAYSQRLPTPAVLFLQNVLGVREYVIGLESIADQSQKCSLAKSCLVPRYIWLAVKVSVCQS